MRSSPTPTPASLADGGVSAPLSNAHHVRSASKWLSLVAASAGLFMLYVDLFIVNVALPAIGRDFHASVATVSWIVTGYVVMIGVLPLGMGRLGDLWGHRTLYLVGLALFLLASVACGLAPTIGLLVVCRALQGVGAAIMTPGTLAIVTRAFSLKDRGLALGIYGGVSSLGLVAGPLLGGLLVNSASWRWVFFINVPIGIVAIVLTYRFVSPSRGDLATPRVGVDWLGLGLLAFGLLGLLLALTHGIVDLWTFAFVASGCALLTLFVIVEQRVRSPLLDMALLRNRGFVGIGVGFLLFSAALFGSQPYTSLFLQNAWGLSPLQGGLAFLPAVGLITLLTPVSGVLGQRAGKHVIGVAAAGAGILGLAFLSVPFILTPHSTYVAAFLPIFLLRGIGIPVFSTCAQLAMLAAVSPSQVGVASGALGMTRNVGTALGVTLLGGVYLHTVQAVLPATIPGALRAAADQFQVSTYVQVHTSTAAAILHGFLALNVAAALCCGVAVVALLVTRHERTMRSELTAQTRSENIAPLLQEEEG